MSEFITLCSCGLCFFQGRKFYADPACEEHEDDEDEQDEAA